MFKEKLRTRMDLIRPDVNKSNCAERTKQKSHHDSHSKSREYFVGQKVQAHNFCTGPHCVVGVIVERLGPLTHLVQVDSEIFKISVIMLIIYMQLLMDCQNRMTLPPNPPIQTDLSGQSDFLPVVNSE